MSGRRSDVYYGGEGSGGQGGSGYDPRRESSRSSRRGDSHPSRRDDRPRDGRQRSAYYEAGSNGEPPNLYYQSERGTEISSRNTSTGGRESSVRDRDNSVTLRAGGRDGTRTDVRIGRETLTVRDGNGREVSYSHRDFGGRIAYREDRNGRGTVTVGDRSYSSREFVNMVREEAAAALVAEGVRAGVGYVAQSIREHFGSGSSSNRDRRR